MKWYREGLLNGCCHQGYLVPQLVGLTREAMDKRFLIRPHETIEVWRREISRNSLTSR